MLIQTKDGILLSIAKVVRDDLEAILALQYAAYASEAKLLNNDKIPPLTQTRADLEIELQTATFLKLTDAQGKIIASIRAHQSNDSVLIGKLIVHPSMQGKGIGTQLLQEVEKIVGGKRYELFTSSKSIKNIRLYEKVGYSKFKEEILSEDVCLIYLQKFKPE